MGISQASGTKSGPGKKFATSAGGGVSGASGKKAPSVNPVSYFKMSAKGSARGSAGAATYKPAAGKGG